MKYRNNIAAFVVGLFLLISMPCAAEAAEYYMSPSGSDSNPGTLAAPWRTLDRLQQAQSILRPGDTIYFRDGDYVINDSAARSYYSWSARGTASSRITYRSYSGEKPVIVGDRRTGAGGTMIYLQDYITIDGLSFRETDGQRLAGGHGDDPSLRNDVGGPSWTPIATWATGVTVRNASIEGFGLGMFYGGRNLLFENNRVWNTRSHRLYISGDSGVFRYNVLGGERGYWNQQGFQVQYNTATRNKIYGNLVYDGKTNGFIFSGAVSYNEVFNNVFINPGNKPDNLQGPGVNVGVWCERNHDKSPGPTGPGNKLYNNTFIGQTKSAIFADPLIPSCMGVRPISRIEIYNNIFYPSRPVRLGLVQNYPNIRNNIFYNIIGSVPPGNTLVDPKLINPNGNTAGDAALQADSPARDAGTGSSFPPDDFEGKPRPAGASYDIGAFEGGYEGLRPIAPPPSGVPPATPRPPSTYDPGASLCPR